MSLQINKSFVPRVAVEKTIRRGIELWQLANDNRPCPPLVVQAITKEVHRLANMMNKTREYKDDETRNS